MENKKVSDYIERMKQEHRELNEKLNALNIFIYSNKTFKTLCDLEQALMIKQSGFMNAYLDILESRIWTANKQ